MADLLIRKTVRFWPVADRPNRQQSADSVEKVGLGRSRLSRVQKRTIWTLLHENQGSSVSRTAQIST